jgi:hypothetical protein
VTAALERLADPAKSLSAEPPDASEFDQNVKESSHRSCFWGTFPTQY